MLSRKKCIGVVLAIILLGTTSAHAHGIWFAERSDKLALIFGVGADDLNMVERLSRVTAIAAYDVLQEPVETSLHAGEFLVVADLSDHPAIVAAVFDNDVWSQKEDGSWARGRRDDVPGTVLSASIMKYTVHLRSALAAPLGRLPGQELQIVPDDAILPVTIGSEIGLRVLYRGEPVAGAEVIREFVTDPDADTIISDKDGRLRLKIRNQGLNVVKAYYESTNADRKIADKTQIVATLSFVLPHEPE